MLLLKLLVIYQKLFSIADDNYSKWEVVKKDKVLKVSKIKVNNLLPEVKAYHIQQA